MWQNLVMGGSYNPFQQFGLGMPPIDQFTPMVSNSLGGAASAGGGSLLHGAELAEGLGGMLQIAAIPGALNNIFTRRDPRQGWGSAGLSGALQGAGVGSMFGPIGTGIGGALGYVSGKK